LLHLQLDNQLPGAVFPIVISPIPLPKSVAVDTGQYCHLFKLALHKITISYRLVVKKIVQQIF